ncbi:MAG: hypothetical protein ACLRXC_13340 [[Clostridium] leptum]
MAAEADIRTIAKAKLRREMHLFRQVAQHSRQKIRNPEARSTPTATISPTNVGRICTTVFSLHALQNHHTPPLRGKPLHHHMKIRNGTIRSDM